MEGPGTSYCRAERRPCVRWVEQMFGDCLCNSSDAASFAFGVAGMILWAVAEIPQIVTNFIDKSASGVSLAFLSTWILGDVLNLVGCILEPTLPTQFYTALLYTVVTVVLALQSCYYGHVIKWWDSHTRGRKHSDDESRVLRSELCRDRKRASEEPVVWDFHFMSARSLVGSASPRSEDYIGSRSGPAAVAFDTDSEEEEEEDAPLPPPRTATQPRVIPSRWKGKWTAYGTFGAVSSSLPRLGRAGLTGGFRVLQEAHVHDSGMLLGWLMAAIYMGGRVPQIWHNIKRGSAEGMSPFMFIFAIAANASYVLSIVVRNCEWKVVKANLPWLLDAVICVLLDLFIVLQFIFYRFVRKKAAHRAGPYHGDCSEFCKTAL